MPHDRLARIEVIKMQIAELIQRRANALPAMQDLAEVFETNAEALKHIEAVEKMLHDDIVNLSKETEQTAS